MKPNNATCHRRRIQSILCATVVLTALPASADVRLPKIFTDNMMLQRDLPVRVWGWADPGEAVNATLADKSAKTKTGENGIWLIELPAIKSGENLELTIKGNNSVVLKNLIIGDLWVCSGQSNMEMTLDGCLGAADDIKAADLPKIRRIKINHEQAGLPGMDAPAATPWQVCSPQTAGGFTAAGFYFAREIVQKTSVPIGIIDNNWGGTPIEPWVATEGLALVDELKPVLLARQQAIKDYQASQLPKALIEMETWIAQTRKQLASGTATGLAPAMPVHPGGTGWSGMYNAMIHPFVSVPIKGALWVSGRIQRR
jgi:sialate O-acetylesterase